MYRNLMSFEKNSCTYPMSTACLSPCAGKRMLDTGLRLMSFDLKNSRIYPPRLLSRSFGKVLEARCIQPNPLSPFPTREGDIRREAPLSL